MKNGYLEIDLLTLVYPLFNHASNGEWATEFRRIAVAMQIWIAKYPFVPSLVLFSLVFAKFNSLFYFTVQSITGQV